MAHDAPREEAPRTPSTEVPAEDVRARWNANAGWWDETVGEGNATQRMILGPATERLLGAVTGRRILDVACGNGHFARRLADRGARVVAVDFSEVFLERARERSASYRDRIEYRCVDLTRPEELRELGAVDAAVCTMALMDMAAIAPLFEGLAKLLPLGAPFVFTVTHPAFNQTGATRGREEGDGPEGLRERFFVRIDRYLQGGPGLGIGIVGQPTGHWYFERSLTDLLAPAFAAGFVVDALEELACPPEMPATRPLSWTEFRDIPPFLAIRLRGPGRGPSG